MTRLRSLTRSRSFTVLLALTANLGVGGLKLAAGLISGSSALMSEAAHSAGDTTTELLLLVALYRSGRPADRRHPFGYGKEGYFWSLLAAIAIFVSGAGLSLYEGTHALLTPDDRTGWLWINYPVLALAAILEGISFRNAARQVGQQSRRRRRSVVRVVTEPDDPTVNSVALEDSAALIGLVIAALGVAAHQLTGDRMWDGAASILIGLLLLGVAFLLARGCVGLLIGRQADPELVSDIERIIAARPEVDAVVDLLTMMVGPGRNLVCARVDFVDSLSAGQLELLCVTIGRELNQAHPELDEVFLQPASRADQGVRERVRARYGAAMADE